MDTIEGNPQRTQEEINQLGNEMNELLPEVFKELEELEAIDVLAKLGNPKPKRILLKDNWVYIPIDHKKFVIHSGLYAACGCWVGGATGASISALVGTTTEAAQWALCYVVFPLGSIVGLSVSLTYWWCWHRRIKREEEEAALKALAQLGENPTGGWISDGRP